MEEYVCKGCGESLPRTEEYFYRQAKDRGGLRSKCKVCHMKDVMRNFAKQPEEYKKAQNKRHWHNYQIRRKRKKFLSVMNR